MSKMAKYHIFNILVIIVLVCLGCNQSSQPPQIIYSYWIATGLLIITATLNIELYRREANNDEKFFWRQFGINFLISLPILLAILGYIVAKDPILLCLLKICDLSGIITHSKFYQAFSEMLFNFSLFLAANAFAKGESLWSAKSK